RAVGAVPNGSKAAGAAGAVPNGSKAAEAAGAAPAGVAGAALSGAADPAAARLDEYIDLVSRKTGMPRAEIARRFDPFRATSYVPEGGNQT
ncbi:MAG: hypothetical protein M0Z80_07500, partial [Treponema sp.]|nr:hypothetical protein [Treponema sp.]